MAEERDEVRTGGPSPRRWLYSFIVLFVVLVGLATYWYWFNATEEAQVPPVVMPRPWVYEEEQPVSALLLWREEVLSSPRSGAVQLTSGGLPSTVARGETVATVLDKGKTWALQSPRRGYYLPWVDGEEGKWDYGRFWPGSNLFPDAPAQRIIENFMELSQDRIIGKVIPLPQWPRALFYANVTPALMASLKRGFVDLRFSSGGPRWRASVRVFLELPAHKVKIAVELPLFPLSMAQSRRAGFLLCAGEASGVVVPESAVVLRDGRMGVYEIIGDRVTWRSVSGRPIGDGQFFVASGLAPGNPVILDGSKAVERRVQLW